VPETPVKTTLRRATARLLPITLVGLCLASPLGAVVIHEIHYHPPEGSLIEFVELYNPRSEPVSVAGWRLAEGIDYEFAVGTTIDARGFVLICKDPERVAERFQLPLGAAVFGSFGGRLSNAGERLTLLNDSHRVIDSVRYGDATPWPEAADGDGSSLQRICAPFEPFPSNWNGTLPSPLAPTASSQCPPPTPPPPPVTFHEIQYHAIDDDSREEFVELKNNTDAPIRLGGYSIPAIGYTFGDFILPAGGLLAVARDPVHLATLYDVGNVVGDLTGELSNGGENLVLLDPTGLYVDSVRYRDHGLWPAGADGNGRSLEKIVATAPSNDPAAWRTAAHPDANEWNTVQLTGPLTRSRFHLYMFGAGEALIDDVQISIGSEGADGEIQALETHSSYDFNAGLDAWTLTGNHDESNWLADGGSDGSGALHLVSRSFGRAPNNAANIELAPEIPLKTPVVISFRWRHLSGTTALTARLTSSTTTRGVWWRYGNGALATPGTPNTVEAIRVPAHVSQLRRFPQEPRSADTTFITAAVNDRTGPTPAVFLEYRINDGEPTRVAMQDDGNSGDGAPADGFLGAGVPPQPHNTVVTFRIIIVDDTGVETTSPAATEPANFHAFYVNDLAPESNFPVYTLLIDHTSDRDPRAFVNGLSCALYRNGSFAFRGDVYYNLGVRSRGQSVCNSVKKYLKVRFNHGDFFKGVRKINLQSLWTDKSLIRERLSWDTFDSIDAPYCDHRFVRLHVNGQYYALYAELEHPDQRYLERNRLDPKGNLYKAFRSTENQQSNYSNGYEKKTNENGDFSDLADFIDTMHATAPEDLLAFFAKRVDEEAMIEYHVAQVLTGNVDFAHKNHYLYHDPVSDRWLPTTWDMDLSYGKTWGGSFGGVLNDLMFTPGANPWIGLGNDLLRKFFSESGDWYRRAYLVRLWDALREKRPVSFYEDEIAFWREALFAEQAEDFAKWGRSPATANDPQAPPEFEPNLERVRTHVMTRQDFLLGFLRDEENFTGHDRVKITEVMYNPIGGQEFEYLELWNVMETTVDVSGWTLSGIDYTFPEGSRLQQNEVVVVAKDLAAFAALYGTQAYRVFGPFTTPLSNGGQELRLKDTGPGFPATVDYLRYDNSGAWPRRADGLGSSLELPAPHPDLDNDPAYVWAASAPGGTPGVLPTLTPSTTPFRRGDINGDGRYNLLDGVTLLRYLAGATEAPACLAVLDVDANESTNITDAVFLLNFVFLGNSPAPPAPGPSQCAPAPDGSCEVSNCS
jgi:hypothetical protein